MRALIVSASWMLRSAWRDAARGVGLQVFEAQDSGEALSAFRNPGGLDVALIDWDRNSFDACALAARIRAERDVPPVRLFMVTGELCTVSLVQAFAAGVDDYLLRPFTAGALADKLARVSRGEDR